MPQARINLKSAVRKFIKKHHGVTVFRRCEFIRTEHADCANEFAPTTHSTAFSRINPRTTSPPYPPFSKGGMPDVTRFTPNGKYRLICRFSLCLCVSVVRN